MAGLLVPPFDIRLFGFSFSVSGSWVSSFHEANDLAAGTPTTIPDLFDVHHRGLSNKPQTENRQLPRRQLPLLPKSAHVTF
jgi:hypothetical protein